MNIFRTLRPPDFISILNALLGFTALMLAAVGRPEVSVLLVLMAAGVDGIDGFLARRTDPSVLGVDLDSLSDLVSFGVAPPAIAMVYFDGYWLLWALGGVYATCGILRLARFNVSLRENRFFEGLPITGAGVVLALTVLLDGVVITAVAMPVLSALMICSAPYPKIRDVRYALPILLVLASAAALWCYLEDLWYSVLVVFSALLIYLIMPVMIWLIRER